MTDSALPRLARPRIAAGVLFRDPIGQALLVKPTYKDGWDIPGGYVEPGESPTETCTRELFEELAIHYTPGRLLVIDWAPAPTEGDKILFIFDGGTLDDAGFAALIPDGREIAEVRFWPLSELIHLTPTRLARRLQLAIKAAAEGTTLYGEHGAQPTTINQVG